MRETKENCTNQVQFWRCIYILSDLPNNYTFQIFDSSCFPSILSSQKNSTFQYYWEYFFLPLCIIFKVLTSTSNSLGVVLRRNLSGEVHTLLTFLLDSCSISFSLSVESFGSSTR